MNALRARRVGLLRSRTPLGVGCEAPFFGLRRRGRIIGQWRDRSSITDRVIDLRHLSDQRPEVLVVRDLPGHLVQLRPRRQLSRHRLSTLRAGEQVSRTVARMRRVSADTVRLTAPAVGGGDRAASKIIGLREIGVELGSSRLQVCQRSVQCGSYFLSG